MSIIRNEAKLHIILFREYKRQSSNWVQETADAEVHDELEELENKLNDIIYTEIAKIRENAKQRGNTIL